MKKLLLLILIFLVGCGGNRPIIKMGLLKGDIPTRFDIVNYDLLDGEIRNTDVITIKDKTTNKHYIIVRGNSCCAITELKP